MEGSISDGPCSRYGVLRISGEPSISPLSDSNGMRVDMPAGSSGSTLNLGMDGRSASFTIDFSNIRGLRSNFPSVEHHLNTSHPNLLLLSETQVSSNASPDLFSISNFNLISRFRSNGGVCAYSNINTPVARLMNLESNLFDAIWLKICLSSSTIILCFCYCPYTSPYELSSLHQIPNLLP